MGDRREGEGRFWEGSPLAELTDDEWERLCDRCGRCCLNKLEDEDTGEIHFTLVACRLLDTRSCLCRDYPHRTQQVPDCLRIEPAGLDELLPSLPPSCAYRRLAEGRGLALWHPLLSGDPLSVKLAGYSVCPGALSEEHIHPEELQEFVIELEA